MRHARSAGPRLALLVVALASRLVSRSERESWRLEWEGEILARWDALLHSGEATFGAGLGLGWRAVGAFSDATFYGKGRWRMNGMAEDVAIAVRTLLRKPSLTIVVIATLAVGIGASTAMFSVARDVLLRPFPYPEPHNVVAVEGISTGARLSSGNVTYPNIHDLDQGTTSFEAVGAARWWVPAMEDDRGSIVLRGATITSNYFSILGVRPGQGRFFRLDEQGEGRDNLVVITHAFWAAHFGADPTVVGRDIRLSGSPYRVIGITAPDFEDPWIMDGPGLEPQVFRTVNSPPSAWPRAGRSWKGIARLRSTVSLEAAQDELSAVFSGLVEAHPANNAERTMRLVPLRDHIAGPTGPVLKALLFAVGILLLTACANLANLLLGRALDRQAEFAVHKALGAAGWRLFNRGLAEAGVLAVTGGAMGLGLAVWLVHVVQGLQSILPRPVTGQVDPAVLAFTTGVTVTAGLLFGLAPALHAARTEPSNPGRDGGRGMTMGRRGHRLRRTLVVGQLALTTMLLVGAGLLVRSFQQLGRVDLGLEPEGVVSVELHGSAWWDLEPAEALTQWHSVMDAVRAVPGVETAGAIDYVPFAGSHSCDGVYREDLPRPGPGEGFCSETRNILPGTLETLGISLVRGRHIERSDLPEQRYVVVVDQNLADALWPDEDPIGGRISVHGNVHEVVGIVTDMRHFGPAGDVRPQLYLHAPQDGWNGAQRGLTVLAKGPEAGSLVDPIRRAVAAVNPSIAVGTTETLDGFLSASLSAERFRTALMVSFGLTALLLAVLGIGGVMSYSVARRTREMGVRLALGAQPDEVRGLVLGEGVRLGVAGIALGLVLAVSLAGAIDPALLFRVGARDPGVYAGVVLLLATATAVSCYAPASRASGVNPVTALSAE